MKKFTLVLGALMILGAVSGAAAQGTAPSPPAQNPSSSTSVDAKTPSTSVDVNVDKSAPAARPGVDVNINKKDETTVRSGRDDGAALPRSAAAGDRTTVFGLSPTAAVIIAAALLVVVILAIVAMTRRGAETTYIDRG